jgi:integrase
MRTSSNRDIDPFITLSDYACSIGDRFLRDVDPTSTAAGYRAGLRLRVLPTLGHTRLRDITTGLVDRAIDSWEATHSRSTLKNTIAVMTRVLDEAVRDELIARNPVRERAERRYRPNTELPQAKLIPAPDDVTRVAAACAEIHPSYSDHVMLSAFLAARSSEVGGLIVRDVDWENKMVSIERQCFPGAGGRSIKPPKGCRARRVPIIEPLEPVLRRLTTRGRATCHYCSGRLAVSSPRQRCVTQPAGTSWLHRWVCQGCAVTASDMRVQPGSQTSASRSTL